MSARPAHTRHAHRTPPRPAPPSTHTAYTRTRRYTYAHSRTCTCTGAHKHTRAHRHTGHAQHLTKSTRVNHITQATRGNHLGNQGSPATPPPSAHIARWVQIHPRVRTQAQTSGASRSCPDRFLWFSYDFSKSARAGHLQKNCEKSLVF